MKVFGMGGLEIVIILVVVLLIFGPKNLPKLGSAIGKTVSNLRAGMGAGKKEKKEAENAAKAEGGEGGSDSPAVKGELEEVVVEDADGDEVAEETVTETVDAEAKPKVRRVVKKAVKEEETVS